MVRKIEAYFVMELRSYCEQPVLPQVIINRVGHPSRAEGFYQRGGQLEEDRVKTWHGVRIQVLQRVLLILALLDYSPDFVALA